MLHKAKPQFCANSNTEVLKHITTASLYCFLTWLLPQQLAI